MSSEASDFGIVGTLSGTIEIQPHDLIVVVTEGSINSRYEAKFGVTLGLMIGGPAEKQAEVVARGAAQVIGDFAKDERRSLIAPLTFRMPLPAKFDPATQWLVFEFVLPGRRTAYVCEGGNMLGTRTWATPPEGGHCWSNPAR